MGRRPAGGLRDGCSSTGVDLVELYVGRDRRARRPGHGRWPATISRCVRTGASAGLGVRGGTGAAGARRGRRSQLQHGRRAARRHEDGGCGAARPASSPTDASLLLGIGSRVEVLAPLGTDRQAQARALAALDAFGSTSLHDAIVTAVDRIQAGRGRRALVLLSDGVDRYSRRRRRRCWPTSTDARRAGVSRAPSVPAAPPLFRDVAAVNGRRAVERTRSSALLRDDAARRSLGELCARSTSSAMTSRPNPRRRPREWRTDRV